MLSVIICFGSLNVIIMLYYICILNCVITKQFDIYSFKLVKYIL